MFADDLHAQYNPRELLKNCSSVELNPRMKPKLIQSKN